MQVAGANSGLAQESVSSLRPGQSNHFSRLSGSLAPPLDMVPNPAAGLQGPHYLRSLVEHRDQNTRPIIRSILDVSFERLQTLQNDDGGHNRITPEVCHFCPNFEFIFISSFIFSFHVRMLYGYEAQNSKLNNFSWVYAYTCDN